MSDGASWNCNNNEYYNRIGNKMIVRSVASESVALVLDYLIHGGCLSSLLDADAQSAQITFFPLRSMWYLIFWLCGGNASLSCR